MKSSRFSFPNKWRFAPVAILCAALALPLHPTLLAQQGEPAVQDEEPTAPLPNDQLDSLVAPIALYSDHLLSQVLVASTYPLEVMQLDQWMKKNATLKDKALADAVAKQPWDPSVQGLAAFPEVVTRMAENVSWTSDVGNAFLAQQQDVMASVQRMRAKAQGTGNLKTSAEQKVESQSVEGKEVIVIEQADPKVVDVPSYDPAVVYGAPAYPYPTYSYPGYVAGGALALGTGLALGAAWGGSWGYGCGWGNGDININNNNNFNKNNINNVNRGNAGNGQWQHNPQHRGNAPYGDKRTANKYGGNARAGGNAGAANRPGGAGAGDRAGGAGAGNRPGGAGAGDRAGGGAGQGKGPGNKAGGAGAGDRAGGGAGQGKGSGNKAGGGAGAGGDKVGGHKTSAGGNKGALNGGGGNAARSASSRGGQSMGGGGASRGGGGGGGGASRGGGGGGGGRGGGGGGGGGRRR